MPAHSPELTAAKVHGLARTGTVGFSTKMKDISITLVDVEIPDMPQSSDSRGGGTSLGSIEDLVGSWANAITSSIFQQPKIKQSFGVETFEHNGGQLVLM